MRTGLDHKVKEKIPMIPCLGVDLALQLNLTIVDS
jgi:hypothetical protein